MVIGAMSCEGWGGCASEGGGGGGGGIIVSSLTKYLGFCSFLWLRWGFREEVAHPIKQACEDQQKTLRKQPFNLLI